MVVREPRAPSALALALAGASAVGTAFGMARYGYGLLLPDIRGDVRLGSAALGAIGTGGYVAYVLATIAVGRVLARSGERGTLVAGGAFAVAGTLVVAAAGSALGLAVGVALAGTSAGLVFPPFAEAAARLPEVARARALAAINCGTGWGVAVAAPIAILAGEHWRLAWVGFAVCALVSTAVAVPRLRGRPARASRTAGRGPNARSAPAAPAAAARRGVGPLVAAAVLVGLGSAAYWTFAVDHVRAAGLSQTAGSLALGVAGIGSLLGIAAADLVRRLGLRRTFVLAVLLEAAAIALTAALADSLPVVLLAALLFGAAYNTAVAASVLRATALHPERPASGLAVIMGANAAGLLCGPLAGGVIGDAVGLETALLAGAGVVGAAALAVLRDGTP